VAIINHPDVRRMLLKMKMYVEGMRSLLYFIALGEDKKLLTDDAARKLTAKAQGDDAKDRLKLIPNRGRALSIIF
jgi:alkylation response protein AidB-like acyl-CoA dehydrogenase